MLVSHDLSVIVHKCDRVLAMKGGVFVDALTRQDLRQGRTHDDYARRLVAASVL